ncbi:MAG: FHA domain-containing protein [Sandaracinaceae bacterium]|nr:FHA domain-containing protein [Sandaracinaceae bacterium]
MSTPVDVPLYIVVGRSEDCDLQVSDASVSGRHAKLSWRGQHILIEDLGSANGTFVDGRKVQRAEVRPGAEVTLGNATLSWSHPKLKVFLRRGARGDTLVGVRIPGRRFICGSCGSRGIMPEGFTRGQLKCGKCGVELQVGPPSRTRSVLGVSMGLIAVAGLVVAGVWLWQDETTSSGIRRAAERLGLGGATEEQGGPATSPQERSIRARIAPRVVAAIDPTNPITRNEAVRLASEDEGPYRVEQVARIWSSVRERWRYVNDPRGDEFFSTASETLSNATAEGHLAGDCDDFAIVLSAMIESIGGEARIVMLDGDQGGHAYAEACIHQEPQEVASRLSQHYRRNWDHYLGDEGISNIHFRSSPDCPVWLNLDWNARVPGGPYGRELWAVSIYPDGRTETLAPSVGDAGDTTVPNASAAP